MPVPSRRSAPTSIACEVPRNTMTVTPSMVKVAAWKPFQELDAARWPGQAQPCTAGSSS